MRRAADKEVENKPSANDALTRAGGAYIPPAKLRMMQMQISDKSSEAYQRMSWESLKKKINGQVNRVNVSNIVDVVRTLLQENIIRGRGLLARSIIQAQSFSPSFSHVFAALVAIVNSKFPNIGELILRRLIIQFKRSFRRNDKVTCLNVSKFLAHLANQRVAHEIIILEILVLLMRNPTDDSIEVAVTILKESGQMLAKVTPKGSTAIFDRLRSVLNDADTIEHRTQYMIETIFHIRKNKFEGYPIMLEELDLIEEEDQVSHLMELSKEDGTPYDPELNINIFKFDPDFEKNEEEYEEIRKEIIGDDEPDSDDEDEEVDEDGDSDVGISSASAPQQEGKMKIIDMTEQDLVAFRRNVYLTIQSSLDFQEAAHKLLKNEYKPGVERELCHMIVDCCAQLRTYERFYGLLAERFCKLRREFQQCFEQIARDTYHAIHRFEITKLRNMAKLIAHLLASDAISWEVLSEIKLNEADTTSSGRIYIKYVFEELVQCMSEVKVYERTWDPTLQTAFEGILPRDNPKNTIFAINFFTLSGLGNLTLDLREHLNKVNKKKEEQKIKEEVESSESSDTDSSSDSSTDDSNSSSSSSDDSSSDSDSSSSSAESEKHEKKISKHSNKENVKAHTTKTSLIKEEVIDPEYEKTSYGNGRANHRGNEKARNSDREERRQERSDVKERHPSSREERGQKNKESSRDDNRGNERRHDNGKRRQHKSPTPNSSNRKHETEERVRRNYRRRSRSTSRDRRSRHDRRPDHADNQNNRNNERDRSYKADRDAQKKSNKHKEHSKSRSKSIEPEQKRRRRSRSIS